MSQLHYNYGWVGDAAPKAASSAFRSFVGAVGARESACSTALSSYDSPCTKLAILAFTRQSAATALVFSMFHRQLGLQLFL